LNKKLAILLVSAISLLMIAPLATAQPAPPAISIWVDKPEYGPGDSGTMYVSYYNGGANAITIRKITIIYDDWMVYRNGQWEGNQTIDVNQAVISKGTYENQTKFTVPNDGRGTTTTANAYFDTVEAGTIRAVTTIFVTQTPMFSEQLITLLTVLLVLMIVCTVIIAATIFLSARRPQVMWKTEEKQ
jgi:sensor c-di-GMP phosphodiesterase-like protein